MQLSTHLLYTALAILVSLPCLQAFAPPISPWDLGARQADEGNCAAAVKTLTSALASAPAPTAASYVVLSDCQAQMNRPADAEQVLRKGLSAHPANPSLEAALGELLMDAQPNSMEAGQLLEHSVRTAPRDPDARHSYAQWAHKNLRERVCVTQERAALLLPGLDDDELLQMNTLLGICSGRIEDADGARIAFRKANAINLRQKTYNPEAAWQYVEFLKRFGEDAEVQSIAGEILARVPGFGPALLERAKYFDREGQPDKAAEAARLALQGAGNDLNDERTAHGILARSFTALGETGNATREQAWVDAHPDHETPVILPVGPSPSGR
jgi:tetratricopeptide (TPR) repeat protein